MDHVYKNPGVYSEEDVRGMYEPGNECLRHCGVKTGNRFVILDVWMDRENYQDKAYKTEGDILEGYMRISVKIALSRPAEFIVINFAQQMQRS